MTFIPGRLAKTSERLDQLLKQPQWGMVPHDPDRAYQVAGTTLRQADLVTTGELLEAERLLGTVEAAKRSNTPFGDITWGRGEGGGNVLLPLASGGSVDIDWLTTLIAFSEQTGGVVAPEAAYAGGKLGWAFAHGILSLDARKTLGHLRAFGNKEETQAVLIADRIERKKGAVGELTGHHLPVGTGPTTFESILHPELVRKANDLLAEARGEAAKRGPAPKRPSVSPKHRSRPFGIEFPVKPHNRFEPTNPLSPNNPFRFNNPLNPISSLPPPRPYVDPFQPIRWKPPLIPTIRPFRAPMIPPPIPNLPPIGPRSRPFGPVGPLGPVGPQTWPNRPVAPTTVRAPERPYMFISHVIPGPVTQVGNTFKLPGVMINAYKVPPISVNTLRPSGNTPFVPLIIRR